MEDASGWIAQVIDYRVSPELAMLMDDVDEAFEADTGFTVDHALAERPHDAEWAKAWLEILQRIVGYWTDPRAGSFAWAAQQMQTELFTLRRRWEENRSERVLTIAQSARLAQAETQVGRILAQLDSVFEDMNRWRIATAWATWQSCQAAKQALHDFVVEQYEDPDWRTQQVPSPF
jgi:hypothetical protein